MDSNKYKINVYLFFVALAHSLIVYILSFLTLTPSLSQEARLSSKPDNILESNMDAAEWNLEVERVLPQLKITIRTDHKVKIATAVNSGIALSKSMQGRAIA